MIKKWVDGPSWLSIHECICTNPGPPVSQKKCGKMEPPVPSKRASKSVNTGRTRRFFYLQYRLESSLQFRGGGGDFREGRVQRGRVPLN